MIATIFIIISLLSLLLFYFGTGRDKTLILIFTTWQLMLGGFAALNVFKEKPNLFPLAILGTVILTFSILKRVSKQKVNIKMMLALHTLRIPVELILYQLYLQNKIPNLMTFKGWNFDIAMGISALALLTYALITNKKFNKHFFIVWNTVGITFLLFIVSLAILSSPLPIQLFAFEQPNIAVLEFPYCLLPTCVVPIVLMSHILLIRQQKHISKLGV